MSVHSATWSKVLAACLLIASLAGATSALAYEGRHRHGDGDWGRGHWVHDRHDGRLGWYWVVGPSWYYYERPHSFIVQPAPPQTVYVQPAPPQTVVVQQAPPAAVQAPPPVIAPPPPSPVLYYCKATGTHYPETMSCPGGWSTMTAETPPQP